MQLARLAEEFQQTSQAKISFRYNDGYPAVRNDEQLYTALAHSELLHELAEPVLQAEDFGVYTEHYPCVFFFLGVGDTPALHDTTFDFDMAVLEKDWNGTKQSFTPRNFSEKIRIVTKRGEVYESTPSF